MTRHVKLPCDDDDEDYWNDAAAEDDADESHFLVLQNPKLDADDLDIVKQGGGLTAINIAGWAESLTLEQCEEFVTLLEDQNKTGNIPALVKPYLVYVKEYRQLEVQFFCQTFSFMVNILLSFGEYRIHFWWTNHFLTHVFSNSVSVKLLFTFGELYIQ